MGAHFQDGQTAVRRGDEGGRQVRGPAAGGLLLGARGQEADDCGLITVVVEGETRKVEAPKSSQEDGVHRVGQTRGLQPPPLPTAASLLISHLSYPVPGIWREIGLCPVRCTTDILCILPSWVWDRHASSPW